MSDGVEDPLEPTLLTCRAVEAPKTRDPFCGLPANPQSLLVAGVALCEDHLEDHISGTLAVNGTGKA